MVRDSGSDKGGHQIPARDLSSEGDPRILTDTSTFSTKHDGAAAAAARELLGR